LSCFRFLRRKVGYLIIGSFGLEIVLLLC
jgi:hypothetical protein